MSGDLHDYDIEMQKVDIALKYGAEGIMDLSNCGKTNLFRQKLIDKSTAMIGTVPMYDAIGYLEKDLMDITAQPLHKQPYALSLVVPFFLFQQQSPLQELLFLF